MCSAPNAARESARLRRRDVVDMTLYRSQELVERGKRQLRFRLDTPGNQQSAVDRVTTEVPQQRGLARTRLTANHDDTAARSTRPIDHRAQRRLLVGPAIDHTRIVEVTPRSCWSDR